MTAHRIVSLLPSATEIVCALGATEQLVGISHECDFPATICDRPALTRSRIDTNQSSRAIDQAVRNVVHDALSVYAVDDALLARLRPDVIVTQDLCEVCAVSLDDVRAAVARLSHRDDVEIVSLRPTRLGHLFDDIAQVAGAIGRAEQGERVCNELRRRVAAIRERTSSLSTRPRVISLEWIDPLMLGGTWMPELIELAGGEAVGVHAGEPAPTISTDTLRELAPDVVLIKPCGFAIARSQAELAAIQQQVLDVLPATTRVYLTDGNAYFNRPGPRLVESLEIAAACVHPEVFGEFGEKHCAEIVRLA